MRLTSIHTYPIKGCHRLDHDGAFVHRWGLAGDRRWMVVDADGVGVTQRDTTRLVGLRASVRPGGLSLRADGQPDLDVPEPAGGEPVPVRTFR
ncbi:MOSC N-terminal beta barrel domain-containing protein, partial [Micromonospora sp. M51]